MTDVTLARINLRAVLRALAELPELDDIANRVANGPTQTIQFTAPRVATVRLRIGSGSVSHHVGPGPNSIHLTFPTAKMVNKMFDGTGNPIPVKGFRQISFLTGPFTELTNRLEHFLKPTPELLADASYRAANSILTLHLAGYALAEIGNSDPLGRLSAERMPDGEILLAVKDGPALTLQVKDGQLLVRKGIPEQRRAKMVFSDLEVAGQVLRGELASYTAIGRDQLELGGYLPLLDNMNKILGLVPRYLS